MRTRLVVMRLGFAVVITLTLVSQTVSGHPSISIVSDTKGNVYYSDLKQVWRITTAGRAEIAVPDVHTHELYIDESDQLFGEHLWYDSTSDKWGHYTWVLKPDKTFSKLTPDRSGFPRDYSFTRDRSGTMYRAEANRGVVAVRSGGDESMTASYPFAEPRRTTIAADGTLYVIDGGDLFRVRGREVDVLAHNLAQQPSPGLHDILGLWTDREGNVYAAIYAARTVVRVAPNGEVATVCRSRYPWSPTGGHVTADGRIRVLEWSKTNTVRVSVVDQQFRSRGSPPRCQPRR